MKGFDELENIINPSVRIDVGDCSIQSVLDTGFLAQFQTSPEIHFHTYYEFLISLDGELEILLNNRERIALSENTICLIPPQLWHATARGSDEIRKLAIRFSISQNTEKESKESVYRSISSALTAQKAVRVWSAEESRTMISTLRELCNQMRNGGLASEAYIQALLTQFYVCFFRLFDGDSSCRERQNLLKEDGNESRRLRIEEYFSSHYNEAITEDDLARHMNLSKRQLSRLLAQFYASSFRRILIRIRLQRAAQLLAESDRSIEEIAYSVGYNSLSGFYSAFLQTFEMTAGEYRKKLRDFC